MLIKGCVLALLCASAATQVLAQGSAAWTRYASKDSSTFYVHAAKRQRMNDGSVVVWTREVRRLQNPMNPSELRDYEEAAQQWRVDCRGEGIYVVYNGVHALPGGGYYRPIAPDSPDEALLKLSCSR